MKFWATVVICRARVLAISPLASLPALSPSFHARRQRYSRLAEILQQTLMHLFGRAERREKRR